MAPRRFVLWIIWAALLALWALPVPGLGHALAGTRVAVLARAMKPLETRFERGPLAGAPITGIVVLGGSIDRTREGIELARRLPAATLVLSGVAPEDMRLAQAEVSLRGRLVIDIRATTTYENAVYSRAACSPRPGERWLLVTSAIHMPRAMASFRGVGFPVEPWPIRDMTPETGQAAASVRHEWLGLAAYRIMGKTQDLFPAAPVSRIDRAPTLILPEQNRADWRDHGSP